MKNDKEKQGIVTGWEGVKMTSYRLPCFSPAVADPFAETQGSERLEPDQPKRGRYGVRGLD